MRFTGRGVSGEHGVTSCRWFGGSSSNLREARSTNSDVRSTKHRVRSTEWPFVEMIPWLARRRGSASALRPAARFWIGHGPRDTGPGEGCACQGGTRCAAQARSGDAAGAAGRRVAFARRAACASTWGLQWRVPVLGSGFADVRRVPCSASRSGLRFCGGCRRRRRHRGLESAPRERLPGGVRRLWQEGQALQDGEHLGLWCAGAGP